MVKEVVGNIKNLLKGGSSFEAALRPEWIIDSTFGALLYPSDAILVTGFWRSGTTWLMESIVRAVGAKQMFEPLLPHIPDYETPFFERYEPPDHVKAGGLMPYCSGSLSEFPALRSHLRRSLTGALPGHFVRMTRSSMRENQNRISEWRALRLLYRIQDALRHRVVVKSVRAHLVLDLIIDEFKPAAIHIRRDPRAVVASYQRQKWTSWLRDACLEDLLLTPEDGRRDHFLKWQSQIQNCDAAGYISKIAGYWAAVEKFVDRGDAVDHVSYEDLCRESCRPLNEALSENADVTVSKKDLRGESHTSGQPDGKQAKRRIYGWKNDLSIEEAREVERVVTSFEMEEYLID